MFFYNNLDEKMPEMTRLMYSVFRFRLQVRVQDATGTCSLSLFNDEVQAIADRSAYQLCDKYGKVHSNSIVQKFI